MDPFSSEPCPWQLAAEIGDSFLLRDSRKVALA